MLVSNDIALSDPALVSVVVPDTSGGEMQSLFERAFNTRFSILDAAGGEVIDRSPEQPSRDWGWCGELCREAARRGRPEFIDNDDPLVTLALPCRDAEGKEVVAVASFLTRPVGKHEDLSGHARRLGMDPVKLREWASRQKPWSAEALKQITDLVVENAQAEIRLRALQRETEKLSHNLASTYEEISLLHRLTQNLKLSKSNEELGRIALEWLGEVIPAACLAIEITSPVETEKIAGVPSVRSGPSLISSGDCPVGAVEFTRLMAHLESAGMRQPFVVNRPITERPDWPAPLVRQMIAMPLTEGENKFGWLAAFNHVEDAEFGTVEASLLSSVAAILGIHGGNIELYRQQSELLQGIIHSLSSAIDAKDPYTCGHSDRVARVAVRLAEELGCDEDTVKTIYMAGLLHDIGKIGIDDRILHKPGKLTDQEYEHIKQHSEIGYRILRNLSNLEDILPIVLHHHESWDGKGYPSQLDAEHIPLGARIVAVADAFDAMSSDRPYRRGMSIVKVDEILRAGAGQQWDPIVVDAFFSCSDELRHMCRLTME